MKTCSICFSNNSTHFTKCNHYYCKTCIYTWLDIKSNCPLCRSFIIKKELKTINKPKNTIKTRSKTLLGRKFKLLSDMDYYVHKIDRPGPISEKIINLEKLFKISYNNIVIIKNDTQLLNLLNACLEQLKINENIINKGYLDKIKLWDYKLNKC